MNPYTRKCVKKSSGNSEEATPVPIPNTEVKLLSADDTWLATARESKTVLLSKNPVFLESRIFIFSDLPGGVYDDILFL